MAAPKRTWLWVILGVAGTICLFVVLVIGTAIFEFRRHVRAESVATATAEQEFSRWQEQFKGQQPLVEFVGGDRDNDDQATVHRASASAPRVPVNTLRVLIYNREDGHLIHADIPGWLLRLAPDGRFGAFQGNDQFARNRITVADIERHGHGLVLDGHNRNTRILVWSE